MKRPDAVKAMFRCCLPGVEFVDSTPAKKKKRQASFKFPVKLTAAELRLVQAAIREHKAETAANRIIKLAGTMYPYTDLVGQSGCRVTTETRSL